MAQYKRAIQLRIICHNLPPTICNDQPANRFGLQDKKGALDLGTPQASDSRLFTCMVEGKLTNEIIDFSGPYVQGPKGERFLYLSWAYDAGGWIKRIKIPLYSISPEQVYSGGTLQITIEDSRTSGTIKQREGWKTV